MRLLGVCQNNLKGLDLDLPLGELIVVTGVSGSGKSSLAFDTVYAEGQRRYVETFSPYARQFLDRMDRPRADRIDGIPPAIAIDQTNPVVGSRSTVGTLTELNDHLKLLFARAGRLFCRGCGREVRRDSPQGIWDELLHLSGGTGPRALVTFRVPVPETLGAEAVRGLLAQQGYIRTLDGEGTANPQVITVIQDRLRLTSEVHSRGIEALEAALERGHGRVQVHPLGPDGTPATPWRFSTDLHCPDCDIGYRDPSPNSFSFNSPLGACETCRGFGRTIGIDWDLVIPDPAKSLIEGAIRPFQSDSYGESQEDLMGFAHRRGIPTDVPWRDLTEADRAWVIEGEGEWDSKVWYGVRRFFQWLEGRSYKMHIRVLLSRYRAYDTCPSCHGARLKDEALDWRLGGRAEADAALDPARRFRHQRVGADPQTWQALPGLNIHDLMGLPIGRCRAFVEALTLPPGLDQAMDLLLTGVRARLRYLCEVGLSYLTLDRQSRTLSGGESQRINLTTALGTALVNTLFVLDEPSIGLHPRDMDRIVGVLHRLRDAGNSLLVVEHDPQVMLAADRILDLGPGPGEHGGQLMFQGTPAELLAATHSVTGDYLAGRRVVAQPRPARAPGAGEPELRLLGANEHNLAGVDLAVPLHRLVVVTGVSGSGKSTLVRDCLYRALARAKGHQEGLPGAHAALLGADLIGDALLVDQSPIGRTSRSNPASYVGALDPLRKALAATPLARERGYTAGTFSFNAGDGRCPTCGGSGFEHLEMQFLADVYLRCPDCDGRRYRDAVLEVTLDPLGDDRPLSIADCLDLTVTQACERFAALPEVLRTLAPLAAVGLGYIRLGQPVPTLSGGEAQRLKLAGHLAKSGRPDKRGRTNGGLLFILDEPTTGLHFDDIATLLAVLRRLLDQGHSLLVIEHNLDVIRAADWVIDLGPEGGDGGGHIVCTGTPDEIATHPTSHTGKALRDLAQDLARVADGSGVLAVTAPRPLPAAVIDIRHAREHNLKDLSLCIPHGQLTVITGVSGSGKSTLAFDVLFAEGQRRYLESLNAYARQFVQPAARADVDAIFGIPPTVAIEQRTSRGGHKSTVGTLTEVHPYLRLLYVKLGTQHCPDCDLPIRPQEPAAILDQIQQGFAGRRIALLAPLVVARKGIYPELAQWAKAQGFATLRVDGARVPADPWPRLDRFREHDIELPVAELTVSPAADAALREQLGRALHHGKGLVRVAEVQGSDWGEATSYSTKRACPGCGRAFPEPDPRLFSYNSKHGWCPTCFGTGSQGQGLDAEDPQGPGRPGRRDSLRGRSLRPWDTGHPWPKAASGATAKGPGRDQGGEEDFWLDGPVMPETDPCPTCNGRRLRREALAVRFHGRSIADLSALTVDQAADQLAALDLDRREAAVAQDLLAEVGSRLNFLRRVGLGYLTLDRGAPTLSGGEAQRIRLAAQLGSNLQGVCYVLDEPTIGLHPRDNTRLLDTLDALQAKGNTVVVVEHDEETIRRAQHVIDLGPGAGLQGGYIVAQGTAAELAANPDSVTGRYLARPPARDHGPRRAIVGAPCLTIKGARLHNLQGVDLRLPLARLVCVTGVSGSGKSSLVREVLVPSLRRRLGADGQGPERGLVGCRALTGWQSLTRVLEVDQTPIGRTPRSCPATYVGLWDPIRRLFAASTEARIQGWGARRFSFNTAGGRCDACEGQGMQRLEMSFLPDVKVPCEVCGGTRFNRETREVRFKGLDIGQVLHLSVDQAAPLFAAHRQVHQALALLREVGLGYLRLGQPSPTLSGGEAQRIKLVTELSKARTGADGVTDRPTLYVLDEPTVGLHMADVERLIQTLHRLVDTGHSVLVIEHNLDLMAAADWLIDLGPEGGAAGGRIVAEGVPEAVATRGGGLPTAAALRAHLGLD